MMSEKDGTLHRYRYHGSQGRFSWSTFAISSWYGIVIQTTNANDQRLTTTY